jgi:Zn-dependent M28 family amino/carboxypeptidase
MAVMRRASRPYVLAAVLLGSSACSRTPATEAASAPPSDPITASAVEAHIRFLASDLLEGREAGTRGYDLAAGYVASQFRQLGLRPGAGTSYLQEVPLQAYWLVKDGARLHVRRGGTSSRLTLGAQFTVAASPLHQQSGATAPAVFAGYGIEAPAFGVSDYEGLDVKGKVVVVLTGYPASLPSEEGAHFGSSREKQKLAAAKGAVAIVSVYTERFEQVSPWARNVAGMDSMQMAWVGPDGAPFVAAPALQASALMSPRDGALLFEGSPTSYADVRAEAAKGAPKGFPLAVEIDIAQQSRHERRTSANVVGVLPGADPALASEHVVVLGHLDHEGFGHEVNGDRLYNGALDNAAGIAGLLETARALAAASAPPRRSVIFLAVTAEEKGLLGAEYFARHPTVPVASLAAAVNIDMPILTYDFTDVIAFGATHSSLQQVVEVATQEAALTVSPDPLPDEALFTRSDHYRFVQQGVPAIFLSTGWNTAAGKGEGGKAFAEFLATHYHRPSDDLNLPINYEAGARFARVNYFITRAIANADARPTWNQGDFFGGLFARR